MVSTRQAKPHIVGLCMLLVQILSLSAQSPSTAPEDVPVQLSYVRGHLSDVLHLYATLSKRKVWVALGTDSREISVVSQRPIPRLEALSLIRGTLLQDYGIDIREVGENEAFVTRAIDPIVQDLRLSLPTASPQIRGMLPRLSPSPSP